MTRQKIKDLVEHGREIEFNFSGKRFSITYYESNGKPVISFCEFYKEITDVDTFDELCKVERYGIKVIDMLESVPDDDIDIYWKQKNALNNC